MANGSMLSPLSHSASNNFQAVKLGLKPQLSPILEKPQREFIARN